MLNGLLGRSFNHWRDLALFKASATEKATAMFHTVLRRFAAENLYTVFMVCGWLCVCVGGGGGI